VNFTGTQYAIGAYLIGLGLLLSYAACLWLQHRSYRSGEVRK
jgi:hypothetical protein